MTDIEKEVITWHKETFPNATTHAILAKLDEELDELQESDELDNFIEEIADVAIVAITFLNRQGTSLSEQIKYKLAINKSRNWGRELPNGDRVRVKTEKTRRF